MLVAGEDFLLFSQQFPIYLEVSRITLRGDVARKQRVSRNLELLFVTILYSSADKMASDEVSE